MEKRWVKVKEFRTPGATGPSLNTGRATGSATAGNNNNHVEQWVEVPQVLAGQVLRDLCAAHRLPEGLQRWQ